MKIDKSKLLGFSNATMPSVPMVGMKIEMLGLDEPRLEVPPLDEQLVVADTDTDSASDIADNTSQDQSDSSDNSEIA